MSRSFLREESQYVFPLVLFPSFYLERDLLTISSRAKLFRLGAPRILVGDRVPQHIIDGRETFLTFALRMGPRIRVRGRDVRGDGQGQEECHLTPSESTGEAEGVAGDAGMTASNIARPIERAQSCIHLLFLSVSSRLLNSPVSVISLPSLNPRLDAFHIRVNVIHLVAA